MARSDDAWKAHTTVEYFDGMGAFLASLDDAGKRTKTLPCEHGGDTWSGGLSYDAAMQAAVVGVPELTKRVTAFVNKIDADQYLTDAPRLFRPAVVGPLVSVPAYLAGLPDCMLDQSAPIASAQGPVTICINRATSGGISTSVIERIGAAVCALALTLQRTRPVEIVIASTLGNGNNSRHGYVPVINLGVSPFDADTLAFAMAHPSLLRVLFFQYSTVHGGSTKGWIPWAWSMAPCGEQERRVRELVGASGEWIYVGGQHLSDSALVQNPEKWVKDQIERLTNPAV